MGIIEDYKAGKTDIREAVRLFGELRTDDKKGKGAVYTPPAIVEKMIEMAHITLDDTVWEPSCGHGAFVFGILERVYELCGDWSEVKEWFIGRCLCTDISPVAVKDLRELVAAFMSKHGVSSCPGDFINIRLMDGLSAGFERRFTLCVGNPPYVRTRALDPDYLTDLRARFTSMRKGNVDIYYAFIQRAVELANRAVLIVPNACMTAAGAAALRSITFPKLREVIDFGAGLPFGDARAYVAIMRFGEGCSPVKVSEGIDGSRKLVPWAHLARDDLRTAPSRALSGLATLSDASFVLRRDDDGQVRSPVTGEVIEGDCVRPLIKITRPEKAMFILHPYVGKTPMPDVTLMDAYPAAWRHLLACRDKLLARDKGKTTKYPAWYAYGRSQGLHEIGFQRIIIIPAMVGGASLPRLIDTTPASRDYGAPLFCSGFVVRETDDPHHSLLSEDFRNFVREVGRPKPGADEPFYAISSKHVNAWLEKHAAFRA